MLYVAAIDASQHLAGTLKLDTAGQSQISVTLSSLTGTDGNSESSSIFFPYDGWNGCYQFNHTDESVVSGLTQTLKHVSSTSLHTAIETALRAAATTASWPSPSNITVSGDVSTGAWTISYSSDITVSWTASGGTSPGNLIGFSESMSGDASHTSDIQPKYTIVPTVPRPSEVTPYYEPDGIGTFAMADDGVSGYGLSRTESPYYRDWKQEHETNAKSQAGSFAAAHPWTFQHLFRHCRTTYPFLVVGGFTFSLPQIFHFRTDGVAHRASYYNQNSDRWTHEFRCVSMGYTGLLLV